MDFLITGDTLNNLAYLHSSVPKRVTIVIDDDLDKKLRHLQAKQILQKQTSVSYSKIINEIARKGLK